MLPTKISICRVYHPPATKDGIWILVDRLWPRGLKKNTLAFDFWLKDIAPSPELRIWFNHDPNKWDDFAQKYAQELQDKPELMKQVTTLALDSLVTLFYAAKDVQHNHALVLQQALISWPKLPKMH